MDNKRLIPVLLLGLSLVLGWTWFVSYLDQKNPQWNLLNRKPAATQPVAADGAAAATQPVAGTAPTAGTTQPVGTPQAAGLAHSAVSPTGDVTVVAPAEVAGPVLLGSVDPKDPAYVIGLRLTPVGAGVESVTLNRFRQVVEKPEPYVFQTPSGTGEQLRLSRVLAVRSLEVNGTRIDLSNTPFRLEKSDPTSAVFTADVERGGAPLIRVVRTYQIEKATDPSLGYEVRTTLGVENRTGAAVSVVAEMNGPTAPPWEIERGPERQFIQGYVNTTSKQVIIGHHPVEEFGASKSTIDVTKNGDKDYPLSWFGANSSYFNAVLRPDPVAVKGLAADVADYVQKVTAVCFNPTQVDGHLREVVSVLTTRPMSVGAGETLTLPMRAYFGPKQRGVLTNQYYTSYPLEYDETLVITSWICSFCTFPWLINGLVWLLNAFHVVVRDWGVAIILLVVLVRSLLHPVTRKAQENMAKMQKLAPELERIKKKYENDKEGMNRAMMDFYKEQGATPIMGCLPMFLQMPIWLALYAGLQSTFELRHQPFLYGLTWINDLAKPDHLLTFKTFTIPLLFCGSIPVSGLNLIPFLLAVVFWFQYKLTPKPPASSPEQEQQQKMMQWMTLLMPVFLYSAPSGLNIYILTSTTFGIIENKLIRDSIKKKEAAEAAGQVVDAEVIDAKSGDDSTDRKGDRGHDRRAERKKLNAPPSQLAKKKAGGIMGWIEEMQNRAEEIRREAERTRQQQQKKKS